MNTPFYVEILNRGGDVRHRQRVEALPIRIGRGYDNDVILDDRHTSAHHVVIDRNEAGGLTVLDLDSRNGIVHKRKRSQTLAIDGKTVFRLGHTSLRVRAADFAVEDEVRDTTFHAWEGWPPALAGFLVLVLASFFSIWLTDTEKMEAIRYVTTITGMVSVAMLWSGGWTLANRIFGGQTRFGRHLFIVACALLVLELLPLLLSVLAYMFSVEWLSRFGGLVAVATTSVMVYFHLVTVSAGHARRHVIAATTMLLLGSALTLTMNYQNRGSFGDELYMSDLYAPGLRLSSNHSVEQLLDASRQLQPALDRERAKLFAEDDGNDGEEDD